MTQQPIDTLTATSIEIVKDLVAFDTVSRHSNIPIIEYIEHYLQQHGVDAVRVPSPDGVKSNLLARIGPQAEGGIVLSGHTDVVPVDGQLWDTDPFTLTQLSGKLYGRGTSDMKSFIAICLAFVPVFAKLPLTRPIWLAFSYDEEVGCLGAPYMLAHMVQHIPKPSFAIIGEPTLMEVVTAHKGVFSFETVVHGLEWHSSQPHLGVNAVFVACELVHFLHDVSKHMATSGLSDERFEPAWSTVHVGTINGGTARNIIPRECSFQWEIRPLPGENHEELLARFDERCDELRRDMKKIHPEADIVTHPISRMGAVSLPDGAQASSALVMHCAQKNHEHAVSFGTEAGVFSEYGIPAIICGPGSIQQAHKPNEFIELAQIRACVEFMLRLTKDDALTK